MIANVTRKTGPTTAPRTLALAQAIRELRFIMPSPGEATPWRFRPTSFRAAGAGIYLGASLTKLAAAGQNYAPTLRRGGQLVWQRPISGGRRRAGLAYLDLPKVSSSYASRGRPEPP